MNRMRNSTIRRPFFALYERGATLLPWIWLGIFLVLFLLFINSKYPYIGHDYPKFCDKLLIGNWHLHLNGLAPLQYTAYFCGGGFNYGDPEDIFYSLLQGLSYFLNFWTSYNITIVFHLIIGYIAWLWVGKDVLLFRHNWAHLFSLIVVSNGFYLAHIIVGHVTFVTFPLMGLLTWFTLRRNNDTVRSLLIHTVLFALTSAWIFHAGGYVVLMFWILGMLFAVPAEILWHGPNSARSRTLILRSLCFAAAALLICASKLAAIYSVMRFYPRKVDVWTFGETSALKIVNLFWRLPQSSAAVAGLPGEIHERSMLISPITILGTLLLPLAALYCSDMQTRKPWNTWKMLRTLDFLIFSLLYLWFMWQLIWDRSELMPILHSLPILSSWRANIRFLYILLLYLSAASIWCLSVVARRWCPRWESKIAFLFSITTVLCFYYGNTAMVASGFDLGRTYNDCKIVEEKFDRGKSLLPISSISDRWQQYNEGATGQQCPNALYWAQNWPHSSVISPGSVLDQKENTFNLMNPACDAYPEENGCKPNERIAVTDRQNFENFRRGLPVTWKVSSLQTFSDWTSLATLIASLAMLTVL